MTAATKPTAIVNFCALANGSYWWIKRSQRRGFWRVLVVAGRAGSTAVNSNNVLEVLYTGREGIDGVTKHSSYDISDSYERAVQIAAQYNA